GTCRCRLSRREYTQRRAYLVSFQALGNSSGQKNPLVRRSCRPSFQWYLIKYHPLLKRLQGWIQGEVSKGFQRLLYLHFASYLASINRMLSFSDSVYV